MDSRRVSIGGRTSPLRRVQVSCATSSTGYAWSRGWRREAAFVVIGATDVLALDDREYREAQLAAGLVEGRLHLAAYSLGAGATGMTFLDSEIHGAARRALDGLLFTCVGVPEYASAAGGPPGDPTKVRTVTPRLP